MDQDDNTSLANIPSPSAGKSREAFRTISEVAKNLGVPQHVLRFWEGKFSQVKPLKRGGGRRYYRPEDVDLLRGIQHLLYAEGYTIKGVQKVIRDSGVRTVTQFGKAVANDGDGTGNVGDASRLSWKAFSVGDDSGPTDGEGEAVSGLALAKPGQVNTNQASYDQTSGGDSGARDSGKSLTPAQRKSLAALRDELVALKELLSAPVE